MVNVPTNVLVSFVMKPTLPNANRGITSFGNILIVVVFVFPTMNAPIGLGFPKGILRCLALLLRQPTAKMKSRMAIGNIPLPSRFPPGP